MHEKVRNSENSRLNRRHIRKQDQPFPVDRLPTMKTASSRFHLANHQYRSHQKGLVNKPPEMIPGATLNKDALADAMHHYLLPLPGHPHERPMGVNLDCCCQDYGMGMDKYLDALSYQSTPSESGRHRWEWEADHLPELF